MTNEEIKNRLYRLYACKTDFTVIQTGKKSSRVNGFYNPATCEIHLYNKNFTTDNQLMYTAIHEFTHHVLISEKGVKTARCHSGIFWAAFFDFVDRAVELGCYERRRSVETQELIDTARQLQNEIIEAQKRLADVVAALYNSCSKNGERVEEVIEHDLQMTQKKSKNIMKMRHSSVSDEMAKAIESAKDDESQELAKQAAAAGKTVDQVKAIAKRAAKATDDDLENPEKLLREKKRIERTIEKLKDRLVQVEEMIISMEYGDETD